MHVWQLDSSAVTEHGTYETYIEHVITYKDVVQVLVCILYTEQTQHRRMNYEHEPFLLYAYIPYSPVQQTLLKHVLNCQAANHRSVRTAIVPTAESKSVASEMLWYCQVLCTFGARHVVAVTSY